MPRWILGLDLAAVVAFVTLGRDTHDEGLTLAGIAETAAPFLIALLLGWLAARSWRDPASIAGGVKIAAVTVAAGILFRNLVFDDGTAFSFIVVATVFLGGVMVGWRAVVRRVVRRRTASQGTR